MYTLCSIYLPYVPLRKQEVTRLFQELPRPLTVIGDINTKSPIWGDTVRNNKGNIFEEILLETDVVVVNDGTATHYDRRTNTYSVIDLTIYSPDCQIEFTYKVLDQIYDSDHYSIHLEPTNNNILPAKINKFNTAKADRSNFKNFTEANDRGRIENI